MRTVILSPRRPDHGRRDELWRFCRPRWTEAFPDWPVFDGADSGDGSFNRSAAINDAARQAGEWDVALIVDSDILIDRRQAEAAVWTAQGSGGLTFAHDEWWAFTRQASDHVMRGDVGDWKRWAPAYVWRDGASGCLAVRRDLWERTGGFDERFRGWGLEDVAWSAACHQLGGGHRRIAGTIWHLWHEPNPDRPTANVTLWERYRRAVWERNSTEELMAILTEPGGPLGVDG